MSYRLNSLKGFLLRLTEGDISGLFYRSFAQALSLMLSAAWFSGEWSWSRLRRNAARDRGFGA